MKRVAFFDAGAAYRELRDDLDAAVSRVLQSGWYLLGAELAAFETEFAAYVGARHCVGCGNGLDALQLTLRAWDIGPGDEVIVPSNTYIATWLAVTSLGATPVPVEPDPETFNLDPSRIESAITPRTKAMIPVHLYGRPAAMSEIASIGARHRIPVLEDAAQGHGASLLGRRAGSLGDAAGWSFYPTKNLGAFGDGGAITTDDAALADRLRVLRNYGSRTKYVNEERGVNSRLDEVHAATLRVKLRYLDEWNARRARIAARYRERLADTALRLPEDEPNGVHVWHVYVIRCRQRDALRAALAERGVETLIHYPTPPHLQRAYADLELPAGTFPISERMHEEVLSLPMGPHLSDDDAEIVCDAVIECCKALRIERTDSESVRP
ncbi:MAG: erythromycin biosynthesis sensory transduction protein eryC1 [Gemmatimonadetes bacterium]|nr:erythromycin biosynthesis sensory transduction protein eryC1 [Gemmatimonadota bacterium]